jgi:hypothetical protein
MRSIRHLRVHQVSRASWRTRVAPHPTEHSIASAALPDSLLRIKARLRRVTGTAAGGDAFVIATVTAPVGVSGAGFLLPVQLNVLHIPNRRSPDEPDTPFRSVTTGALFYQR